MCLHIHINAPIHMFMHIQRLISTPYSLHAHIHVHMHVHIYNRLHQLINRRLYQPPTTGCSSTQPAASAPSCMYNKLHNNGRHPHAASLIHPHAHAQSAAKINLLIIIVYRHVIKICRLIILMHRPDVPYSVLIHHRHILMQKSVHYDVTYDHYDAQCAHCDARSAVNIRL